MDKNEHIVRVLQIMEHYGMNQRQFALRIGISPQSMNTMIVRNSELKVSTIVDILKAFQEVSVEWLVLGKGEMIKDETEVSKVPDENYVTHLEEEIEYLRRQNMLLLGGEYKKEKSAG